MLFVPFCLCDNRTFILSSLCNAAECDFVELQIKNLCSDLALSV
jgi:hypothetical protein